MKTPKFVFIQRNQKVIVAVLVFLLLYSNSIYRASSESVGSTAINSYGTVRYVQYIDRLLGVNHCWWNNATESEFQLLADVGANAWLEDTNANNYNNPDWRVKIMLEKQWADDRGIRFIRGAYDNGVQLDENPQKDQLQADIIMNANGAGDRWISDFGNIIQFVQPYGIDVMNEPGVLAGTSYAAYMTEAEFFEAYRQFCIRCIDAWRLIKPDLVVIVHGQPFWDLHSIASNPIPRSNLLYSIHFYYAYGGYLHEYSTDWEISYLGGDLTAAKTQLYNWLLYTEGVQNLLDAGLTPFFEELGSHINNPNALIFFQDVYDFAKIHNIGFTQCFFNEYPATPSAMIAEEDPATLNSIGEFWAKNMFGG
jgi:hypothetical protein